MTTPAFTTPTPGGTVAPSTDDLRSADALASPVSIGQVVLVRIDDQIWRPLIVAAVHPDGSISGPLMCEAGDHTRPAFRAWESHDGARISGRPDRHLPIGYGELLQPGMGLGQWMRRPPVPR